MFGLQQACLLDSLQRIGFVLDKLEGGPLQHPSEAAQAVVTAGDIAQCKDAPGLLASRKDTDNPQLAHKIRSGTRHAFVELSLGNLNGYLDRLLVLEREYAGFEEALIARLELQRHLGHALNLHGRFAEAETRVFAALLLAERHRSPLATLSALRTELAIATSSQPGGSAQGISWGLQALATEDARGKGEPPRHSRQATHAALARAYIGEKNYPEALRQIDAALLIADNAKNASAPDRTGRTCALNLRGVALQRLGQAQAAYETYQEALATIDTSPVDFLATAEILNNLGLLQRQRHETQAALTSLRRSAKIKASFGLMAASAATGMNIGNTFAAANRLDEAIDAYDNALKQLAAAGARRRDSRVPQAELIYNRAIAKLSARRWEQAVEDFSTAFAMFTTLPESESRLHGVLVGRGTGSRFSSGSDSGLSDQSEARLPATNKFDGDKAIGSRATYRILDRNVPTLGVQRVLHNGDERGVTVGRRLHDQLYIHIGLWPGPHNGISRWRWAR